MVAHKNGRKDRACLVSKAIKKYGIENFIFEKLAILENHMIDETEQKAIKVYNSISPEEHKQRIRECNKGKVRTEENKKKISEKRQKGGLIILLVVI